MYQLPCLTLTMDDNKTVGEKFPLIKRDCSYGRETPSTREPETRTGKERKRIALQPIDKEAINSHR